MATPKPGEIRCPTCHRSTPPAAYCTKCGTAIPADARARPRGMDRDELQERIRARRSGGDPYRRGNLADEEYGGFERFEPEPEDAGARRRTRGQPARRADHLGDTGPAAAPVWGERNDVADDRIDRADLTRDDYTAPIAPPPSRRDEPAEDYPPDGEEVLDGDARADYYGDPYDDAAAYPYPYDEWGDERERRSSGTGAFAILGFLALGVLALLGGAFLAGIFSDDGGVGVASPSPTIAASVAPSVAAEPSTAPSIDPSAGASGAPPASGEPVEFPDGFVAEAQPCLPGSAGQSGCSSNGAQNAGALDIWVGFENGSSQDVIGVQLLGPDGNQVGQGSIPLADIGCSQSCQGYTWFNFRNLAAGTYEVLVTRNGDPASQTGFEVS